MRKPTRRELEARLAQIRARMRMEAVPFEDVSEEARKERVERSRRDPFFFFKTYLPHYFSKDFAKFQYEWVELADIPDEPVFIAAPREHAKSTIFSLGIPVRDICLELKHFIVLISDTEDLAADFCSFIQLELEENERIKTDFGELRGDSWESKDFITRNGVRVKARGRGQRIRGLRNRQYRVDRIIVDDLENDKNVKNPRLVKETVKWLLEAVINTLAEGGSFTMVGTKLSKKSVLSQMMEMKEEENPSKSRFISRTYRAIEDGEPIWPEVWSMERLRRKKRAIGTISFNKEFMNDPRDEEGLFREEWIRYYHPEELRGKVLVYGSFYGKRAVGGL